MADGIANFLMLVVTDVIVTMLVVNHLDVMLADVFCHVVDYGHFIIWLMMLPLWQMNTFFVVVIVADGKATL